ncbi:MAG: hypothetical protein QOG60_2456 [Frankiaceae bacterium]|nr:hypothetical protein [Frankiaceae bacterium]MDQ1650399.1 hypothetical protein [Frankiaceae bacterium]
MNTGANDATADTVLSEERLLVGTKWVPRERLSVRRRVVTETRQVTVTVRREELLIDRAPVVDEAAVAAPSLPSPLVVVLREEVPVVEMQVRPYERVTVGVERISSEEVVGGVLGREQAELVVDQEDRRG